MYTVRRSSKESRYAYFQHTIIGQYPTVSEAKNAVIGDIAAGNSEPLARLAAIRQVIEDDKPIKAFETRITGEYSYQLPLVGAVVYEYTVKYKIYGAESFDVGTTGLKSLRTLVRDRHKAIPSRLIIEHYSEREEIYVRFEPIANRPVDVRVRYADKSRFIEILWSDSRGNGLVQNHAYRSEQIPYLEFGVSPMTGRDKTLIGNAAAAVMDAYRWQTGTDEKYGAESCFLDDFDTPYYVKLDSLEAIRDAAGAEGLGNDPHFERETIVGGFVVTLDGGYSEIWLTDDFDISYKIHPYKKG